MKWAVTNEGGIGFSPVCENGGKPPRDPLDLILLAIGIVIVAIIVWLLGGW